MSLGCNCGSCISHGVICVPKGNSKRIIFNVVDSSGNPFSISNADEIEFLVYTGITVSGNITPGGTFLFKKTLSDGGIVISGGGDSFYVDVTNTDSVIPVANRNYYEVNVTTDAGNVYTVSAGTYQADFTIVGNM